MSLCEILAALGQLRGRIVSIRGVIIGLGGRHGPLLVDYLEAEGPCTSIQGDASGWPAGITLAWPKDPMQHKIVFEPLRPALETINEKAKNGQYEMVVLVTMRGTLQSRSRLIIKRVGADVYMGNGYGEGGQYPAQLMVEEVSDVELISIDAWQQKTKK